MSDQNIMSGQNAERQSPDARTVENLAADWFGRRQFWAWSEEEQVELDAWLAESLAHQVAYWRLAGAWDRTERLNAIAAPMRVKTVQDQTQRGWPRAALMLAGAAAVLAVVAIGWQTQWPIGRQIATYSTRTGEMKTVTLADGSSIDLNTNTVLSIDLRGNGRAVRLQKGEAYFQVRHDSAHPFTVAVGDRRITDLGTKFVVRENKDRVQVSLIEGKAKLDSAIGATADAVILVPGDVAVASRKSLIVSRKAAKVLSERLSWRSGMIAFDNATLGDAASEFNRYNRVQLVITDPAVARIPIAGKFPTNGVNRFADVIEHVFGLHVQSKGGEMVISR